MQPTSANVDAVIALMRLMQMKAQAAASKNAPLGHYPTRDTDVTTDDQEDYTEEEEEGSYVPDRLPLLVNSSCPSSMRRTHWSISDYDYKQSDRIPGGTVSEVYKARCRVSGQSVVLKVTDLDCDYLEEAQIHTNLNHPNIVQCHAAWQHSEDGIEQLIMVMEEARGGDLSHLLRDTTRCPQGFLDEKEAVSLVVLPLLKALGYLHSKGVIHRDVKLENILFATNEKDGTRILQLCDYGVSKQLNSKGTEGGGAYTPGCGTMAFIAREVFDVGPEGYGCSADIWSLGVLTFRVLVGSPLFQGQGEALRRNILEGKRAEFPARLSEHARSFISDATLKDPSERPDAFELMRHPWILKSLNNQDDTRSSAYSSDLMSGVIRKLVI